MSETQTTAHIDHLVITCRDMEISRTFYTDILGFEASDLEDGRVEIQFGFCKINLQPYGRNYGPSSNAGRNWNCNFCILTPEPVKLLSEKLIRHGIEIEQGPAEKIGAMGPILSIYIRDPDKNLVEISNPIRKSSLEA
ncbi:MAG: VOC family protein [Cohaesibacteraceae bacterium]|nr:VOC family protein [Cohaesibacteraceae bacterium]